MSWPTSPGGQRAAWDEGSPWEVAGDSQVPAQLPRELIPGEQEGPCITAGFFQVLTNEKVSLGASWGLFVFKSGVNTFGTTKKRG